MIETIMLYFPLLFAASTGFLEDANNFHTWDSTINFLEDTDNMNLWDSADTIGGIYEAYLIVIEAPCDINLWDDKYYFRKEFYDAPSKIIYTHKDRREEYIIPSFKELCEGG